MPWYAVIGSDSGEVQSYTTTLPRRMRGSIEAIEIEHPPEEGEVWDPVRRAIVDATPKPNRGNFIRALAAHPDFGMQKLVALDREYPGVDRAIGQEAWDIALGIIDAMLALGALTQDEYTAVQVAWDQANLGRPESP